MVPSVFTSLFYCISRHTTSSPILFSLTLHAFFVRTSPTQPIYLSFPALYLSLSLSLSISIPFSPSLAIFRSRSAAASLRFHGFCVRQCIWLFSSFDNGQPLKKKEGRVNVKFTGKAAAWLPFFKRSEGSRRAPRLKSRYGNGLFRVICSRASEEAARLRKRARKRCAWGANFPQA